MYLYIYLYYIYIYIYIYIYLYLYMCSDLRKPTKLSHLVLREIPILNIQATVVLLC